MSYDVALWLPLILLGCLAGAALIVTRKPLAGAIVAGLVAALFVVKLRWIPAYDWSDAAVFPTVGGWADEHVTADGVRQRARWARELLFWAAPPMLVAAWGAVQAARTRRSVLPLSLLLPAMGPTAVLVAWVAAGALTPSPDDPRWVMGYVREWQANGRSADDGGACHMFLDARARLAPSIPAHELDRALDDCQRLCQSQSERGAFNPGVLQRACDGLSAR